MTYSGAAGETRVDQHLPLVAVDAAEEAPGPLSRAEEPRPPAAVLSREVVRRLVAAIQVQLPASPVALKACALQWALPGAQLPTRLPGLGVVPGQLAVGYQ